MAGRISHNRGDMSRKGDRGSHKARVCALILSSQWPAKVVQGFDAHLTRSRGLDALPHELEDRGVDVMDGQWGSRPMIVADPEGDQLYFSLWKTPAARHTSHLRPCA